MRDIAYAYLLRSSLPLLAAPLGVADAGAVRLRGVFRTKTGHARIAVSAAADLRSGVALDVDLETRLQGYEMDQVLDFVRVRFAAELTRWIPRELPHDVLGNIIVDENAAGLTRDDESLQVDADPLRGLTALLSHSSGYTLSAMQFELRGFVLLNKRTCRVYVRTEAEGDVGLQMPLNAPGVGATFCTELDAYAQEGDLTKQPRLDVSDEYCDLVVDMSRLVNPAHWRNLPANKRHLRAAK